MEQKMDLSPAISWQKQPEREAVVWQHNSLAEARYELTAREQKLLLYVIAMIEPEDEDFKRYVVNISEFAALADLQKDDLYRELRDLAKSLKQKPLIIPHHFDHQTKSYLDLVTSWFETAYIGKNGAGYFAVTLSPVLKPYLLQVKREFFRFRLYQVMQLRSGYAIRLYQWAKRWEFRKSVEISVQDLRTVLGANNSTGSSESRGNLAEYADFKRRAIKPAIDEINKKTDLSLGFRELKRAGSKAIDRLVFSIKSEPAPELEVLQPPPLPQLEFALETEPEDQLLLQECMNRYGLSESQRSTLQNHYAKRGVAYIREKMIVVDQEPRQNAAKAFLAALRDDWKPKIQTVKPPSPAKKKTVPPQPEEVPVSDEERAQTGAKLREFIETLRTSR
jgi:plasmid replication initiation protein